MVKYECGYCRDKGYTTYFNGVLIESHNCHVCDRWYNFDSEKDLLLSDVQALGFREKHFDFDDLEQYYKKLREGWSTLHLEFTAGKRRCFEDMIECGDLVDCGNGKYKFSDSLLRDTAPLIRERPKIRRRK
jgi:hypothetical protein